MSEEKKQKLKEYQKNYLWGWNFFFSFHCIKNGPRSLSVIIVKSVKSAFHKNKKTINTNEVYIERIALIDKKSYGKDSFKYFIGYRHEGNSFPSPLSVTLSAKIKYFDKIQNIWIF